MKAESELQVQLAENMMSSTEPAWLRQPANSRGSHERNPRSPKQSPACPPQDHKFNESVFGLDLDQDNQQNLTDRVIDVSSRVSSGLESLNGNFQLQLDDSDVSLDDPDTEAEERRLLSQLHMEGSFSVNKSLSEQQQREASRQNISLVTTMDESADDSIMATRKKRAAVIYDSEEEDEEQRLMKSQLENSFQALGASTPKSGSTPARSRRSVGGNTSVASRRSLLRSIMEVMDDQAEEEDEGHDDERSDEAEEAESYECLVSRGKECFSRAQLDEALGFFLRAIDIQPGDPEVQLMTIQLYRQLSQRSQSEAPQLEKKKEKKNKRKRKTKKNRKKRKTKKTKKKKRKTKKMKKKAKKKTKSGGAFTDLHLLHQDTVNGRLTEDSSSLQLSEQHHVGVAPPPVLIGSGYSVHGSRFSTGSSSEPVRRSLHPPNLGQVNSAGGAGEAK
ncbi:DNA excision repair protein ERCC-6-like [Acanthochromis polyacanthus]|uniref:DNA excision repair protein ERCC-6-like n=1 Tax=Acanthochromis polyacanthus TaxID=80966 RepID=UPI002234CBC0|nr:DNA excision repair protein ERCC-6-like [Acanthochromis polyacanthus]